MGPVDDGRDDWELLASPFVKDAYATVKGKVRTFVVHEQLLRHLPPPPATVLDVGGGAGHQSLPLARLGSQVTILDPSPAMLSQAAERLAEEPAEVRRRVELVESSGEQAALATGDRQFDGVLCHGVLMYVADPVPLIGALAASTADGGAVSILALNARTMAVRPALERRFADALSSFEATSEQGILDLVEGHGLVVRFELIRPFGDFHAQAKPAGAAIHDRLAPGEVPRLFDLLQFGYFFPFAIAAHVCSLPVQLELPLEGQPAATYGLLVFNQPTLTPAV